MRSCAIVGEVMLGLVILKGLMPGATQASQPIASEPIGRDVSCRALNINEVLRSGALDSNGDGLMDGYPVEIRTGKNGNREFVYEGFSGDTAGSARTIVIREPNMIPVDGAVVGFKRVVSMQDGVEIVQFVQEDCP